MEITFSDEQTQNAIDFSKMEQKSYKSVKQFEEDLKWFVHNCRSIFAQCQSIKAASKELIGCVKAQIQTIQACTECYEDLNEFFTKGTSTKQCSQLHLLLWAKATDCNIFRPAKVLAVNADKKLLQIQFFGDYSCWFLETMDNDFYLYSDECPEKRRGPRPKVYSKALKVSFFCFTNLIFFQFYVGSL